MKLKTYITESDEKIKKWLSAEIGRSMGNKLTDYSESEIKELMSIYKRVKDIKKAVEEWSFS